MSLVSCFLGSVHGIETACCNLHAACCEKKTLVFGGTVDTRYFRSWSYMSSHKTTPEKGSVKKSKESHRNVKEGAMPCTVRTIPASEPKP